MNRSRGVVVFDIGKSIAATRLSPSFSGSKLTLTMQHWLGQYTFDECFEPLFPGGLKTVGFEFTYRTRFFGFFAGEIRDDANGIPESATVKGKLVSGKTVRFKKTYPRTWAPTPGTGELCVFDNRPHVVYYKGVFPNPGLMDGTWEIRSQRRVINGLQYEFPRLTGTWNAEKK